MPSAVSAAAFPAVSELRSPDTVPAIYRTSDLTLGAAAFPSALGLSRAPSSIELAQAATAMSGRLAQDPGASPWFGGLPDASAIIVIHSARDDSPSVESFAIATAFPMIAEDRASPEYEQGLGIGSGLVVPEIALRAGSGGISAQSFVSPGVEPLRPESPGGMRLGAPQGFTPPEIHSSAVTMARPLGALAITALSPSLLSSAAASLAALSLSEARGLSSESQSEFSNGLDRSGEMGGWILGMATHISSSFGQGAEKGLIVAFLAGGDTAALRPGIGVAVSRSAEGEAGSSEPAEYDGSRVDWPLRLGDEDVERSNERGVSISTTADLIATFSPFEGGTLERAIDQFLDQLGGLDAELSRLGDSASLIPNVIAATVVISIAETARRRLRDPWDHVNDLRWDDDVAFPGLPGRPDRWGLEER